MLWSMEVGFDVRYSVLGLSSCISVLGMDEAMISLFCEGRMRAVRPAGGKSRAGDYSYFTLRNKVKSTSYIKISQ